MNSAELSWIANFIWNIADDVLRDVFVRGKYRDVILPMCVLRRLDAVLAPTKDAVLAHEGVPRRGRHHRGGAGLVRRFGSGLLQHLAATACAT
jgi:hypothetical protein